MSRAHYEAPIQDLAGNIQAGTIVAVFQNGTTTLLTAPLWADGTSSNTLSNPFTSEDGNINFYLDIPQRVDLGIAPPGQGQVIKPDIDVLLASTDSASLSFPGTGTASTVIGSTALASGAQTAAFGASAAASGDQSTALGEDADASATGATAAGQNAQATAVQSTALGTGTAAAGSQSLAVGAAATANGNSSTAAGGNSSSSGVNSTALGSSASAGNTHSTAVGAGATTTENQQIRLGTPTDYVDMPSYFTLLSDNSQIKFRVYLTDAGVLYTRYHYAPDATNLLTGNDANFDGGIGGWTAGSHATPTASAVFTDIHSTGAMLLTQSAAGPAYAISPLKAVAPSTLYVAKAWFFRHAADGSATQFQAWVNYYDLTSTLIGSAVAGPPQTIINDTWIVADVRAQSPSNAAFASLQVGVPSGGANTDKLYVDTAGIFLAALDT